MKVYDPKLAKSRSSSASFGYKGAWHDARRPKPNVQPTVPRPAAKSRSVTVPASAIEGAPAQTFMGQYGEHHFVDFLCDESTGQVSARFEFRTVDRVKVEELPLEQLTKATDVSEKLTGLGINVIDGTVAWTMAHAHQWRPAVTTTKVGGWRGDVLVNCFGTFGLVNPDSRFEFDAKSRLSRITESKGTPEEFLDKAEKLLKASNLLTLLYSASLWSALADRLGVSGGITFCITGNSSQGKTSAIRLVQSLTGRALTSDLVSMNLTDGFADSLLPAFGGSLVPFSDLKTSKLKGTKLVDFLRDVVFAISDSTRRLRLNEEGIPQAGGYKIGLMSFETGLAQAFEESGVEFQGGEACRFFDLVIEATGGIYDCLSDPSRSAAAASFLEKAVDENYGVLTPAWAGKIAEIPIEKLRADHQKAVDAFATKFQKLSPLERRICKEFANIYAAGVIGYALGLQPIAPAKLFAAVEKFFIHNVGKLKAARECEDEFVGAVKSRLLAIEDYPLVHAGDEVADSRAELQGFFRDDAGKRFLYVKYDYLKQVGANGLTCNAGVLLEKRVLHPCKVSGVLVTQGQSLSSPVRQLGIPRSRYLRFDFEMLKIQLADLQ